MFLIICSAMLLSFVQGMIATARQFSWEQAAILFSDDWYGREGKSSLLSWAKQYSLCISNVERIPAENLTASQTDFDRVLSRISQNLPSAPAVLVFASKDASLKLLQVILYRKHNSAC